MKELLQRIQIIASKRASNKLLEHTNTDCSIIPNGWDPGDFPKSLNKKQI